ncbi:MAG: hypothetical protein AB8I08_27105 [Sandaracinaceae bacterium]
MKVVLLGPQRFDPSVADAAAAAGIEGRIALVTAGWQEREPEDDELSEHLGGQTVNLRLHHRADHVFATDPEFRANYRARQLRYRQLQDFYRIRLEHHIEMARVIALRSAPEDVLAEEWQTSIEGIQALDAHHRAQCEQVREVFRDRCDPADRPAIKHHREKVVEMLADCQAVAIAGGHVASLLNRLHLFGLSDLLAERPVLAWSAGAMALTDNVVLFHDFPPHGADVPQMLDVGLGLAPGRVVLPGPETRLAVDEPQRMSMYATRFAPRRCVVLPRRSWMILEDGECVQQEGALSIDASGALQPLEVSS